MLAVVRLMVALDTKTALPALADLKEVTLREATGALIMAEAATEAIAIKRGKGVGQLWDQRGSKKGCSRGAVVGAL